MNDTDLDIEQPIGTVQFTHSKLFHPAVIEAADNPIEDPTKPTQQQIIDANMFAKNFASTHGLMMAEDMHVGNMIPRFIDQKTGKDYVPSQSVPQSKIKSFVPPEINSLEWDDSAKLPYYDDPQSGEKAYVPQNYFFLPRFNPNRGKPAQDLIAKK